MNDTMKAFVIMPFDEEFENIYDQLIKPSLEEAGYVVSRADRLFDRNNILRDIVRGISEANLVIAELTIGNPNVYYELGLCHGLKVATVLMAQSLEEIPFDLRSYRILTYSTEFDKVEKLKRTLIEIGKKHINKDINFESPVTDFQKKLVDSNLTRSTTVVDEEGVLKGEEIVEEEYVEEAGFLDFITEGLGSIEEINTTISTLSEATVVVGDKISMHGANMQRINENPTSGGAAKAQTFAYLAARDMDKYSETLELFVPVLESNIEVFAGSHIGYIKWYPIGPEENMEQYRNWRNTVSGLQTAILESLVGIRSFRKSTESLIGISRVISKASRRVVLNLGRVIEVIERLEASCSKALLIMNERIDESGVEQTPD